MNQLLLMENGKRYLLGFWTTTNSGVSEYSLLRSENHVWCKC